MPSDAVVRTLEQWRAFMKERGQPAYRAAQIFSWIHEKNVLDAEQMTNLPKALRTALSDELGRTMAVARVHQAADATKKLLVEMADGRQVETVLLPVKKGVEVVDADAAAADHEADDDDEGEPKGKLPATRVTQCISTQVGCAMGCVFCASGIAGLDRHMTASEIVSQVLLGRALLDEGERLSHVVFMGMGEPLHNYDATALACRVLTRPDGIGLSPRRLTISTSGLVPEIDRLGQDFEGQIGLAISLHNPDDEHHRDEDAELRCHQRSSSTERRPSVHSSGARSQARSRYGCAASICPLE